jgi:hypothetical protein
MTRDEWQTLNNDVQISLFLAFYNLQLEVNKAESGYKLTPKAFRRLMKFFESKTTITRKVDSSEKKDLIHIGQIPIDYKHKGLEAASPDGTLRGYQQELGIEWFKSGEFQGFLHDVTEMQTLVRNALDGTLTANSFFWFQQLANTFALEANYIAVPRKTIQQERRDEIALDPHFSDYSLDEIKIHRVMVPRPLRWHGLMLTGLGEAIHKTLEMLLLRELPLRECAFERCTRIFIPSYRNFDTHTFCSSSCRSMESRLKSTP